MTLRPEILAFRFGYGLPLANGPTLEGPDLMAETFPLPSLAQLAPDLRLMVDLRKREKAGEDVGAEFKAARTAYDGMVVLGQRSTYARAVQSNDPLRERLVSFFADHFTTRSKAATTLFWPYALVDEAIRPHVTGSFADMLVAVTLHPEMLTYLDQQASIGPNSRVGKKQNRGLNENLAREVMELHTLGLPGAGGGTAGGYTQDDVRQLAELLTGLTITNVQETDYKANWAEPGAETVLGRRYDGEGMALIAGALRDLAAHPATARHMAWKLAVHFISDMPDAELVAALEAEWTRSGGHLPSVMAALMAQPQAADPTLHKIKQPFDFIVASSRALGISGADIMEMKYGIFRRIYLSSLTRMGQPMKAAPGPDGWPEETAAWLTPPRLAARIDWAMEMPERLVKPLPDPVEFAQRALGARADKAVLVAAARAESRRDALGIILSSPQFQRR